MNYAHITAKRKPLKDGGFQSDDGYIYGIGQDGVIWRRRLGLTVWSPAPEFNLDAAIDKAVTDLLKHTQFIGNAAGDELRDLVDL